MKSDALTHHSSIDLRTQIIDLARQLADAVVDRQGEIVSRLVRALQRRECCAAAPKGEIKALARKFGRKLKMGTAGMSRSVVVSSAHRSEIGVEDSLMTTPRKSLLDIDFGCPLLGGLLLPPDGGGEGLGGGASRQPRGSGSGWSGAAGSKRVRLDATTTTHDEETELPWHDMLNMQPGHFELETIATPVIVSAASINIGDWRVLDECLNCDASATEEQLNAIPCREAREGWGRAAPTNGTKLYANCSTLHHLQGAGVDGGTTQANDFHSTTRMDESARIITYGLNV
ncbi:hypothetical protein T492DRAFT_1132538 [Pavlovales sp. CCMP2436]|nr:hypothetical protein T492DRAFT_1132538 [Pavlovales sp. CCMP2436]